MLSPGSVYRRCCCPLLVYGWLGLPRLELPGSAVANLAGQWLAALLFCRALLAERISLRVDRAVLRAQVVLGRDLFVRIVAFQVCFVSAAAVAARFGAAAVAAHQVVVQLWNFLGPLHQNRLYCPETKPRYRWLHERLRPPAGTSFPDAEHLYDNLMLLPHRVLLSSPRGLEAVVAAFDKVARHAGTL